MKRRILSALLVLAMVLSMVPVSVTAGAAVEASPKAGTHADGAHAEDCGLSEGWTAWTETTSLPTEGQIVLMNDVKLAKEVTMTGDLTICLNGYVVTARDGLRLMGTKKNADTTLTICDCTAYEEDGVYYAGALTGGQDSSSGGGAVFVRSGGSMKLYDGRITGNLHTNDNTGTGGGAIFLQASQVEGQDAGKFFMYGGEISNNRSANEANTSTTYGGAIFASTGSYVEITGGRIFGNEGSRGGAIYAYNKTNITIQNADISNNIGGSGGALGAYGSSVWNIENCTLTGNTATNGSAIYGESSTQITIKDTTITGNIGTSTHAEGRCAAIYVISGGTKVVVGGKTVIADNQMAIANMGNVVLNNAATDTLYIQDLTEGSRITLSTPKTAAVEAKEVLKVNQQQTAVWNSGWVKYVTAEGQLKDVGLASGQFVWGHFHGDQEYTALENAAQLAAGGHYYLAGDVQLDKCATLNNQDMVVDLCLNGHELQPAEGKQIIKINGTRNITLTIDDCTAYTDDQGVYHAGALTGANTTEQGGAVWIGTTNTLYLRNGKITGNTASHGGGIFAHGTIRMSGGEISNNTAQLDGAWKNGGGIYLNKNTGLLYITGGSISNNHAGSGGAIYAGTATTVLLQDVTISGNNAATYAGGVYVSDALDLTVSGTTKVTGNTVGTVSNNLYLLGTTMVKMDELSAKSKIGVTLHTSRMDTGNLAFTDAITENPGCFTSDNGEYTVELVSGKLTLVKDTSGEPVVEHKHTGCNDAGCADGHEEILYEAWTDATRLPSEGNWYLDTDVTVSATVEYGADANKTLNLCLNGHTITQQKDSNAKLYESTKAGSGVTITIGDCTAYTDANGVYHAGKITGFVNSKTNGAVLYLRNGSTLEIYDGIFSENRTVGTSAGALMIDCLFHMYGGEFSGNVSNDGQSNAGAIYLNQYSVATITGGTFKNNLAGEGGAIYANRDNGHLIANCVFIGNEATKMGGAVVFGAKKDVGVTIKNCTFENNKAGQKGSAVRVAGKGVLEDCTFTGNQGGCGAVYVNAGMDMTLIGKNQITGNEPGNLYLESNTVVKVQNATGTVGVTLADPGRAFTADCADFVANFVSDNADFVVRYQDGKLHLVTTFAHTHCVCGEAGCTEHAQISYGAWSDATKLPAEGNWCLTTDVTVSEVIKYSENANKTLNLCLHGHTITQKEGSGAQMYHSAANAGVTITISDCSAYTDGDGVYHAGTVTGFVGPATGGSEGSLMYLRLGTTLNIYDGIFSNNHTPEKSGGAMLINGVLNIYRAEFTGNTAGKEGARKNGGALYLNRDSVVTITNATFKDNMGSDGGAIYSYAQLTITDSVFTGNQAATNGGALCLGVNSENPTITYVVLENLTITGNSSGTKSAVYLQKALQDVTLKGNMQITGNQGGNLNLVNGNLLKLEALDPASKIAVNGKPLTNITGPSEDYSALFVSDNTKYEVVYLDGALFLDATGNHKHCFCAGQSQHCDHDVLTYVEWDDPTTLPTEGNYYLSVDVELKKQSYLENSQLNLCLNGHNITVVGDDTRMIYTRGDAVLNLSDCTENPGVMSGGTRGSIVTESVAESGAVINLWNGVISGNETTSIGGAILLQSESTLNMFGGKITGNTAKSVLKYDEDGKVILDDKGNQTYTSSRGGGAVGVHGEKTTFNMYGGEISGNKALQVTYLDKTGAKKDDAGYGGAIYVYKGTLNVYGGKIINNQSERSGGALFTQYATVEITGGEISGNYAGASGGAAYFSTGSQVNITSDAIRGNSSKSSGGGIICQGKETVVTLRGTISGNTSIDGSCGGVLCQGKATFRLLGGKVTGNSCKSSGGGVYISSNSTFIMEYGSITNNYAKGGAGGLIISANSTARMTGGSVSYNRTDKQAAGIRLNGCTVTMTGVSIVGNVSVGSGAGLMTNQSSVKENNVSIPKYVTLNMYNCYVAENESADGAAGGLLFQSKGTVVNMSGCTVEKNKAASSGGGMYASTNVTITVKDCTFSENEGAAGAGFRINNCLSAYVENVVVKNNIATSSGAGVMVAGENCKAELKNLEVFGNEGTSGGGMVIQSQAQVKLTDSKFYDNTAFSSGGGGIYIGSGAIVEAANLEIYNNEAAKLAGGFYDGAGTRVTADNLNIHHNRAGESGGGMQLGGATILTNSIIANNSADGVGGAISTAASGSMYTGMDAGTNLINCQILDNTAGSQGGAINIHRGGPVSLTDCVISGNEAGLEGGAIYANGKMKLTNVSITDNISLAGRHIIYLTPAESDGHTYYAGYKTMVGTIIMKGNQGGGVYLAEGIPLVLEGQLGADSVIQVTLSDGLLTKRVLGVYDYEGSDLSYVITAGNRSLLEPVVEELQEETPTEPAATETIAPTEPVDAPNNTMLYAGIGAIAVVLIAAAAVVIGINKKKAGQKAGSEE